MTRKKRGKKKWGKQLELFQQLPAARPLAGEADLAIPTIVPAGGSMGDRGGSQQPGVAENPYEYGALLDYIEWNEQHHKLDIELDYSDGKYWPYAGAKPPKR